MTTIELLDLLTKHAQNYRAGSAESISTNSHMNEIPDALTVPQIFIDAVLVDFINHIAAKQCIDYALYTRDIATS